MFLFQNSLQTVYVCVICTVSEKMHQFQNGIAQNYKDQFDDVWQKYSKDSRLFFETWCSGVGA